MKNDVKVNVKKIQNVIWRQPESAMFCVHFSQNWYAGAIATRIINLLIVLTLLKIISLDTNGIRILIRNPIIYNKQSSCIGYTIVSGHRILLTITEAIFVQHGPLQCLN